MVCYRVIVPILSVFILALGGCADKEQKGTDDTAKAPVESVVEHLSNLSSTFEGATISSTKMEHILEVRTKSGDLYYTDIEATHLFKGTLFNISENRFENETKKRQAYLDHIILSGASKEGIIVFPATVEETAKITVFTDVTCPYCQRLHSYIGELNKMGVTVQYYAFPRHGLNSQSKVKHDAIWCAEDPSATLTDAMSAPDTFTYESTTNCENVVSDHFALAQRLSISTTPTIFSQNGFRVEGFLPPERLSERLKLR